jgi:circadian clock protein KaiC
MKGRMKTGIAGLDTLLDGGFLYHNSILIKGPPGSGKTTLGFQMIHNGLAMYDEPGLVISFDQFPQQFRRDMASFGWDIDALGEGGRFETLFVSPEDIAPVAAHLDSMVIGRIQEAIERTGAVRVLVDSISHFKRAATDPVQQRVLLMGFLNQLKTMGLTPILTAELGARTDEMIDFEEYVVDCVVILELVLRPGYPLPERTIEVRKARGQQHVGGKHLFKLTSSGIEVYPHKLPESLGLDDLGDRALANVSSGIVGLDRMLQGGFTAGVPSLVAGVSGTYKTTVLAHFLEAGAQADEPGLLISFEEPPPYFIQVMRERGIDLEKAARSGKIQLWHRVAKACHPDELFHELKAALSDGRIRRVAIDSLNDFERCVYDNARCKDYLVMFNDLLMRRDVTALYTQKIDRLSGRTPIGDIRCLSQFDTVVYLGHVEIESQLHKVVSILKRRGAKCESALRAIECRESGLVVTEKFMGLEGIFEGSARGQYKKTVEELLQPVVSARDFLKMARQEGIADEQRAVLFENIDSLLSALNARLREHFGTENIEETDADSSES